MSQSCFVIMPIGKIGSEDHTHFRAVFDQLKQVIREHDYDVVRADDVHKSGSINRDIITRLGEADLVIADLTDLNPNVLYEVGVRHSLRGGGTVLLQDTQRTPAVPFDLGEYRVIKYVGQLTGIGDLRNRLRAFLEGQDRETAVDSPVHTWFPTLPRNVISGTAQSTEAPLRQEIKRLERRIEQYKKAYGPVAPRHDETVSPMSRIAATVADAEAGILPASLLAAARQSFFKRDVAEFLTAISGIVEGNSRIGAIAYLELGQMAEALTLAEVEKALLDQAVDLYPRDHQVAKARMQTLAHSNDPQDVRRAIRLIVEFLDIGSTDGTVDLEKLSSVPTRDHGLVAIMLDAYHREGLDVEALKIAEALLNNSPRKSIANRNYARALEKNGRTKDAWSFYRTAVLVDETDDGAAVWLGNELHNRRRRQEAVEAYALACVRDPADAENFAHLMQEIAGCYLQEMRGADGRDGEGRSGVMTLENVLVARHCALSCPVVGDETRDRVMRVLRQLEVDDSEEQSEKVRRRERLEFARGIYTAVKSGLTTDGVEYEFDYIEEG